METKEDLIKRNIAVLEEFIRKFNVYAAEELTKATLESVIDYNDEELNKKYKGIGLAVNLIAIEYKESKSAAIAEMIYMVNEFYCGVVSDGTRPLSWVCDNMRLLYMRNEYLDSLINSIIDRILNEGKEVSNDEN